LAEVVVEAEVVIEEQGCWIRAIIVVVVASPPVGSS
jgi:hypothetical protein